jgi:DNA polymerase-3 subunit gamma/tau
MSYQVLARKWRPKSFQELVGQESVVRALVNGLDNDRVHHAFLLTGTRGVGKTTLARILAKCLNCETGVTSTPCGECGSCADIDDGRFPDMMEIDAASRTKVDDTRELLETVQFTPSRGRYKVYIIDEVHMLSASSFNALLKTLEEPPSHVKFVLATTDAQKIPLASEDIEAEAAAIARIARAADGSMRDGLSLLDQAIAYGGGKLLDDDVAHMLGSVDHAHVAAIIESVANEDAAKILEIVAELAAQARDLETVLSELAEIFHRIGLVQVAPGYTDPERSDWDSIVRLSEMITPEDAQLFYQIAIQGGRDLGIAPDPRTGLEMTLLRMMAFRPADAGAAGGGEAPVKAPPARAVSPGKGKAAQSARARPAATPPAPEPEPTKVKPAQPSDEPSGQKDLLASENASAGPETEDWHGLLPRLELDGPVKELARNIQLESKSGDRWQFLIPDTVRHLGSDAMVQKLQTALSSQLGHPVQLAIHTASEPVVTPAVVVEQATQQKMSEAERSIEQDPTVRVLKERFGAEVVEDSVQPLQ